MATNYFHFLITLSLITLHYLVLVAADDPCPYPCNPPPIAGTITPPTPTTQTGSSYPPPTYSLPPPSGNLPNYRPPYGNFPNYPPGGGSYSGGMMPPPPDPILPYFPYYYRNGVHQPSDQYSSSTAVPRSTVQIIFTTILVALSSSLGSLFFS